MGRIPAATPSWAQRKDTQSQLVSLLAFLQLPWSSEGQAGQPSDCTALANSSLSRLLLHSFLGMHFISFVHGSKIQSSNSSYALLVVAAHSALPQGWPFEEALFVYLRTLRHPQKMGRSASTKDISLRPQLFGHLPFPIVVSSMSSSPLYCLSWHFKCQQLCTEMQAITMMVMRVYVS